MLASAAPASLQRLLAAQARGLDGASRSLAAALDGVPGLPPALRAALERRQPTPAEVLAAAAAAAAHPCPLGVLLARLLSASVISGTALLAAVPPDQLAAALADLHAAAASGTLLAAVAGQAQQALETLVKLLITAAGGSSEQGQARDAERTLRHLRSQWSGGGSCGHAGAGGGAALLAAVVRVVYADVFPRQRAISWLVAELAHVLRAEADGPQQQQQQQQQGLAAAADVDGWADAMAAFAAALPAEALLQQAQQAAWEASSLHAPRAAALLAAAAVLQPAAQQLVEAWATEQAHAALQQRATTPLHSLLRLQRELALRRGAAAGDSLAGPAHLQQQQQSAREAYRAWFAGALLAPGQQPHLQFLVQALTPLLPEEAGAWLAAQAEMLDALTKMAAAARPGHPQQAQQQALLPPASLQAVAEYLQAARQRLRAVQQQDRGGGGGDASPDPSAPRTDLQRGQDRVARLLKEFLECGGQLRADTVSALQAEAASLFHKRGLFDALGPAMQHPTGDAIDADKRAALMEYLGRELERRGDAQLPRFFRPEVVAEFRRRCGQAQLERASLAELAQRAPQLLQAPGTAAQAGPEGGVPAHQLLGRLGRLVAEQLAQWREQQARWPGSGAAEAGSPEQLAGVLVDVWTSAYTASQDGSGGGSDAGAASPLAVAAHLLNIAHGQPLLHAPMLRRLRQLLLGCEPAAGLHGSQQQPQQQQQGQGQQQGQLEAAAMLAAVAGALVRPEGQQGQQQLTQLPRSGPASGLSTAPERSAAVAEDLQPLFVWRQQNEQPQPGSSGAQVAEPVAVPGPLWLQHQLQVLPLRCALERASAVAAAHFSCLHHFSCYSLLPDITAGTSAEQRLALRWCQPAAAAGRYEGEHAASLVFPACTPALRLQQWLLLRLSVARRLLPGAASPWGDSEAGPAAKRQRSGAAGSTATASGDAALHACSTSLQSGSGAPLAAAAGKLPLASLLRLEAAAARSGSELLPPGSPEAVLHLCCALYLEPGADAELGGLLQPLDSSCPAAEEVTIPDTDDEEEDHTLPSASPAGSTGRRSSAIEGLAAAVAAVLGSGSGGVQPSAALAVCQFACAQVLRLLATAPGAPSLSQLLAELLGGLVGGCFQQQGSVAAAAGAPWQLQLAAGPLASHALAGQTSQRLLTLATGLALELLPQPLGAGLEQQRRQLAVLAAALEWALSDDGLSAGPAPIRQRLQAALATP